MNGAKPGDVTPIDYLLLAMTVGVVGFAVAAALLVVSRGAALVAGAVAVVIAATLVFIAVLGLGVRAGRTDD